MAKLLVIDGYSMAFRAFFALPADKFTTASGQHTNAVHGFTSMLINLVRDEQPTHVAVAFDAPGPTFRSEGYDEYKAGRAVTPPEFHGQVDLIKQVLDALTIAHTELPGFEADDILATWARQGVEQLGAEVAIISGDRDTFQLVNDHVTVLYPIKGVSEMARMTPDAVEAKYGVGPSNYPDLAALVGETADNLPGIPGVGPKTAAKWIGQYGSAAAVLDHRDDIKGKAGESLRAHVENVQRNIELNRLRDDLTLDLSAEQTDRRPWSPAAAHAVFDALEFRTLRERLLTAWKDTADTIAADDDASTTSEIEPATPLDSVADVEAWLAAIPATEWIAVQPQGGDRHDLGSVGLSALNSESAAVVFADHHDAWGACWQGLASRPVVMHEWKRWARHHDVIARCGDHLVHDTHLAAYLLQPDHRTYSLETLALSELGIDLTHRPSQSAPEQPDLGINVTRDEETLQAGAEVAVVRLLAQQQRPALDESGAASLLSDIEIPVAKLLSAMERAGIAVDTSVLTELDALFAEAITAAQRDAWDSIGDSTVNLGSPKQLQVVLFDTLGMPKTKKTKTGYTTDADALADLQRKANHPFLASVLRFRDVTKLRSVVEGLMKARDEQDQRIHSTFHQTIAATGRLSSTEPNLQNIPVRTEEGRRIRRAFVPGPGFSALMAADYSQIEMRIMAHLSGDQGLIDAFTQGEDLHRYVGSRIFAVDPADVDAGMRAKVKAMSYGLAYGLSAFGLSKQLNISTGEATALMDGYFERFGGVRDYLRRVVEEARSTGFTTTMFGRRRYLPDLNSDNRQRRDMAERMALNAPIQGTAADIVKVAMIRVGDALEAAGAQSRVLLQVHDELVIEVATGEEGSIRPLILDAMTSAAELSVPLEVHLGVGATWQDAGH